MPAQVKRHLSTSSSSYGLRPGVHRAVFGALAVMLLAVAACEVAFRQVLPYLSENSRTLADASLRAQALRAVPLRARVLILGNSVGRESVDPAALSKGLRDRGVEAFVAHQPADGSSTRDWYYELSNMFIGKGAVPRWLILPVGKAHPLLEVSDRTEDLVFSFLRFSDLPQFFDLSQISSSEAQAQIVVMKLSALYGFRGRIQKRLLVALVPRYQHLRESMDAARGAQVVSGPLLTPVWSRLIDKIADAQGVSVVVVATPTSELNGILPAADRQLATELGWHVLEPAIGSSFGEADRRDSLHLTPPARARFTSLLAPQLAALMAAG